MGGAGATIDDEIFDEGKLPGEPLLYVCSPTQTDETLAPHRKEIVFILAIVPNLAVYRDWPDSIRGFRERILARMRKSGIDIRESDIELEKYFTPKDFESVLGSFNGTAFGLAPDFLQSAVFRPRIKSRDIRGLYHTGMSTHPGGGIPMVLTSGRLAAEQVAKDFKVWEPRVRT